VSHRTIIEEPNASESLDGLKGKHERFDSQWLGFSWLLCRTPELSRHKLEAEKEYRLMHRAGDSNFGLMGIAAVYTYDDNQVILIDIQAWDEEREDDES
jgi:hypothetical protein